MKLPASEPSRWTESERQVLTGAPLAARLLSASRTEQFGFHMPGHQAGRAFSEALAADLFRSDTTELPATDDLNDPGPALQAAQAAAAKAFGAAHTFFLTGGSTQGLHALMLAACGRGGRMLIGPSTHRSVLHAAALFDIHLNMVAPDPFLRDKAIEASETDPNSSPLPSVSPAALGAALSRLTLEQMPADAVLLTSPDYYGATADIRKLAGVCRRFGVPLLIDEAHGAHFAFAPRLMPEPALMQGAAAVVQSAHKTLPALTPAALLHLSNRAAGFEGLAAGRVFDRLIYIRTSSPSLMVAATVDWARSAMGRSGERLISQTVQRIRRFGERLSAECRAPDGHPLLAISGVDPVPGSGTRNRDPLRLVIDTRAVCPAPLLAEHLSAQGIRIEFADPCRLVLIVSPFAPPDALPALADALIGAVPVCMAGNRASDAGAADRWLCRCWHREHPDLMPGALLLARAEAVPLAAAAGRRLAAALTPYPPGIPILWPGDILTHGDIERLSALLSAGLSIEGVRGGTEIANNRRDGRSVLAGDAFGLSGSALSSINKSCIIDVIAEE